MERLEAFERDVPAYSDAEDDRTPTATGTAELGDLYRYAQEEGTARDAIRWAADHDALTGLLTRTAFMRDLRIAFEDAKALGCDFSLLLLDIGSLHEVNERYGQEAGDELLRQIAMGIMDSLHPGAFAARTGSDEFAICLTGVRQEREASLLRIKRLLEEPVALDGQSHRIDGSIGVALYPRDAAGADELYRSADLALSEAKAGCRFVHHFDAAMRERNQLRLSTFAVVRDALERGTVFPYYQPQTELRSGRIIGFEALLRWEHRQSGVQNAAAIASAFQDHALAAELDQVMFDRIAADMRAWREQGIAFGRIGINTSVVRFHSGNVADDLLRRIADSHLDPAQFELEITEDVLIGRNPDRLAADLDRLRAAGMTVALDDFGTGFASLIHLKKFAIDTLKIDCSFVQNLDDRTNGAVVSALIRLGKQLSIRTVAEGVETQAQAAELRRKGCDVGQGYLFSPAVPASEVPMLLDTAGKLAVSC